MGKMAVKIILLSSALLIRDVNVVQWPEGRAHQVSEAERVRAQGQHGAAMHAAGRRGRGERMPHAADHLL